MWTFKEKAGPGEDVPRERRSLPCCLRCQSRTDRPLVFSQGSRCPRELRAGGAAAWRQSGLEDDHGESPGRPAVGKMSREQVEESA